MSLYAKNIITKNFDIDKPTSLVARHMFLHKNSTTFPMILFDNDIFGHNIEFINNEYKQICSFACKYLKGGLKFMSALATAMQALEWKGGLGFINWLRCEPHQILRPVFMLIFYHWHSTNTKYSRGGKQHTKLMMEKQNNRCFFIYYLILC